MILLLALLGVSAGCFVYGLWLLSKGHDLLALVVCATGALAARGLQLSLRVAEGR